MDSYPLTNLLLIALLPCAKVWEIPKDNMSFVRVLFEGTPVFELDWIPLDDFIALLESNVSSGIYQLCNSNE